MSNYEKNFKSFTYISGICSIVALILMIISMIGKYPELVKDLVFLIPGIPFVVFLYLYLHTLKKGIRFDEMNVIYSLQLDEEGNAWIEREATFVNNSDFIVKEREHHIFSSGAPIIWPEIKIGSWDKEGHTLPVKLLEDRGTIKVFAISFFRPIKPKEVYNYAYRLYAKKFFCDREEWFDGQDICARNVYKLKIPKNIKIQQILCEELTRTNEMRPCYEIKRDVISSDNYSEYVLEVLKTERFNNTRLVWQTE